jgi:hypothetical protein
MNNVAIAFSTKDRLELSRKSIKPLLQPRKFDLFWIDGSKDPKSVSFARSFSNVDLNSGVSGGSGAAIVFALSQMLNASQNYAYIGLVENDCLLPKNWFEPTMVLFEQGKADGLNVGAVSCRCYEDRILIQRDDYAVMHNLGAGQVIFSRPAAEIILNTYRTQWTTENRMTFVQLSCADIGRYWAFKGSEHWLCADWRWDAVLAARGYVSLALTPSHVKMIGQNPPLEQQGLTIARKPVDELRGEEVFKFYRDRMAQVYAGERIINTSGLFQKDAMGGEMIFAHQIAAVGGRYAGGWQLKDSIGFGPFGWKAKDLEATSITIPALGPCSLFLSGGEHGGRCEVTDKYTGFMARPDLPPEGPQGMVVPVTIPANAAYREVTIKPLTTGITFYGMRALYFQPRLSNFKFDYTVLPPP